MVQVGPDPEAESVNPINPEPHFPGSNTRCTGTKGEGESARRHLAESTPSSFWAHRGPLQLKDAGKLSSLTKVSGSWVGVKGSTGA